MSHLLELGDLLVSLFQRHLECFAFPFKLRQLRVTLGAQVHLAGAIARLQWYMLWPLAVMLPPVVVLAAQMQAHYQWRPLAVGDASVLRLTWAGEPGAVAATCPDGGVTIEVGPVVGATDVVWRVRAVEPGRHVLQIQVGEQVVDKEVVVGETRARISPLRPPPANKRSSRENATQRMSRHGAVNCWIFLLFTSERF